MRMQHDLAFSVANLIGQIFRSLRRLVELLRGRRGIVLTQVVEQKRQQSFRGFLETGIENLSELVLHHHDAQTAGEKP